MRYINIILFLLFNSNLALSSPTHFMEPQKITCKSQLTVTLHTHQGITKILKSETFDFNPSELDSLEFSQSQKKGPSQKIAKLFPRSGLHGVLIENALKSPQKNTTPSAWTIESDERTYWILKNREKLNSDFVICRSE